jgi:hypothetical protein
LSSPVFVKNLKPANEVFGLSRGAKPIGPVQDAEEKIKVNCQSETCYEEAEGGKNETPLNQTTPNWESSSNANRVVTIGAN